MAEGRHPRADRLNVLVIAGWDPSGGAGITLDTAVVRASGLHGLSVLTTHIAQNSERVSAVKGLPAGQVREQLEVVTAEFSISAVKIGHQGYEGYGRTGGNLDRQEHFLFGPNIDDVDPNSMTGRLANERFTGAVVTDSDVTLTFGDHNQTKVYAISGNTANIDVRSGGNILMTHADPQLRVTQNMYARQQGGAQSDLRWSPVAGSWSGGSGRGVPRDCALGTSDRSRAGGTHGGARGVRRRAGTAGRG